jgi:hypothetical protein
LSQQHGAIERLDARHKGLRLDVDLIFDAEGTLADVQAMLLERYKEQVPISTIGSYKERRYTPQVEQVQKERTRAKALKEQLADGGLDDIAEANIAEQLMESRQAGERASLQVLLREQRERSRLQLDRDRLKADLVRIENESKDLAAKLEGLKSARQREREQVKAAVAGIEPGETTGKDELLKHIDEIYGVYQEADPASLPSDLRG